MSVASKQILVNVFKKFIRNQIVKAQLHTDRDICFQ